MTTKVCPICKGEGVSKKRKFYNGVCVAAHFGDGQDEYEQCWMCGGTGEVDTEPSTARALVTKYWMRGSYAGENSQAGE